MPVPRSSVAVTAPGDRRCSSVAVTTQMSTPVVGLLPHPGAGPGERVAELVRRVHSDGVHDGGQDVALLLVEVLPDLGRELGHQRVERRLRTGQAVELLARPLDLGQPEQPRSTRESPSGTSRLSRG